MWEKVIGFTATVMLLSVISSHRLPPLAVMVRVARPYSTLVGFSIWFLYRALCPIVDHGRSDKSLLDALVWLRECVRDSMVSLDAFPLAKWLWIVCEDVMVVLLVASVSRLVYCLLHFSYSEWKDLIVDAVFEWSQQHIPMVQATMQKHKAQAREDTKRIMGRDPNRVVTTTLPKQGRSLNDIMALFAQKAAAENEHWQVGKVSGAVYAAEGGDHSRLMHETYAAFTWSNPLHTDVWPTVTQCEAEVISMTANLLYHGGKENIVGTTTSGGTESIILAIKAHRDCYGRQRGIQYPEIICGPTAHAAVDKACDLLGLRKVSVACDPYMYTLIPSEVEKHITSNTIMIYASAPSFPQGVIDPIEELSSLALRYGVGLHVDACLGGFVLPFAKQLGYAIPKFDFDCPGVTSMSADTHKFAYATKGTSVVLYRTEELRHAQYFTYSKWTGGMYSTPTIAGSRSGALLACAWAALVSIGEEGYQSRVKGIMEASQRIADGIAKIDGIRLLGNQLPTMVVCFTSDEVDIYRVNDVMSGKGWSLNALQHPPCLHICVTLNTVPVAHTFIEQLKESVEQVRKEGAGAKKSGSAAIYGMTGSIPAGPVNELLRVYTDMVLTP